MDVIMIFMLISDCKIHSVILSGCSSGILKGIDSSNLGQNGSDFESATSEHMINIYIYVY